MFLKGATFFTSSFTKYIDERKLIQSESHQVLNIKDRHLQLYSHKSTDDEQSQQPFPQMVATLYNIAP